MIQSSTSQKATSIYWCLHVVVYNFLCIAYIYIYIYIYPFGFLKPSICCTSGISLAKGDDLWTNLRPAMGISRGPGKISRLAIRNGQNPSENMDNNDNTPQMPMKIWRFDGKTSGRMGEFAKGHVSENRWVSILVECKPGIHLSTISLPTWWCPPSNSITSWFT